MTMQAGYAVIVIGLIGVITGALIIWLRQNDQDMTVLRRELTYSSACISDLADVVSQNTAQLEIIAKHLAQLQESTNVAITAIDDLTAALDDDDVIDVEAQSIINWAAPENEGTAS